MTEKEKKELEDQLFKMVKMNLRQITNAFDEDEIKPLMEAVKEDMENSIGHPFDIGRKTHWTTLIIGVKARFGTNELQEKFEAQYQRDLSKLGTVSKYDSI